MTERQLALPCEIVKKSNALARARWSVESVWEPRLVALLASKVRKDDIDFQIYKIPITELIGKSEKKASGRTYTELTKVVDHLMSRVLTIQDKSGRGWVKYNVFSRCRYCPDDGILELRFDPDLKPHYLNLQTNFAKYNLLDFLLLPSVYSQRLFEFLKSWDDKPETSIQLIDLHEMLNAPKSFRTNFAEFRRRVLDKAYKDIHKHTSLRYEWAPIKTGRKVTAIRFIFSKPRQEAIVKEKKEKIGQQHNRLFLKAAHCWKEHGQNCSTPNSKTSKLCNFCKIHIQNE